MAAQDDEHQQRSFPATGLGFLLPPVIWAVLFVVLYSLQGAYCAAPGAVLADGRMPAVRIIMILLVVLSSASIAILALAAWRRYKRAGHSHFDGVAPWQESAKVERFLLVAVMLNAGLFLVASIWVGAPVALLQPCG